MNTMDSIKRCYEVALTQEAWAGVEAVAQKLNLSVSELFEKVGQGLLVIVDPEELEDLEDYLGVKDSLLVETELSHQERIPWELVQPDAERNAS
jgi:hypothetical protein